MAPEGPVEIKLYGRGGQGVVTAGELLAQAALNGGLQAQSIPAFGPERRGGPAFSSVRLWKEPILLKYSVLAPSIVMVLDPTIWRVMNVLAGTPEKPTLIMNTPARPGEVRETMKTPGCATKFKECGLHTLDATGIAMRTIGKPIPNAAMLGSFAKVTGLVSLDSVKVALRERFGDGPAQASAEEGYSRLRNGGGG